MSIHLHVCHPGLSSQAVSSMISAGGTPKEQAASCFPLHSWAPHHSTTTRRDTCKKVLLSPVSPSRQHASCQENFLDSLSKRMQKVFAGRCKRRCWDSCGQKAKHRHTSAGRYYTGRQQLRLLNVVSLAHSPSGYQCSSVRQLGELF